MVTRFDKSSKTRNGAEYILIWRTIRDFGEGGKRIVMKAVAGDAKALDQVEEMAWFPRKRPALVRWVERKRKEIARRASEQSEA
jgi:hypothetical protein